ncbi:PEP-CTERM motif protein [Roseimaritima multifibrata]|uniref:PEP-CTERM motif protein n=1 Tax=Roseimaritima multifibrata TaxID=1930274 RepID=A0A517MHP4_9BACT|nr:PEP-CTERM sorting domain-containing protein [Roseimaritima multifibrata]QDS94406.1 PEP-CTERM motif protein [Roseimaritima multifibrata]
MKTLPTFEPIGNNFKSRIGPFLLLIFLASAYPAHAATIIGGFASWTLDEGVGTPIHRFDAYFDATTPRDDTLALAAPGNKPFDRLSPTQVSLADPIRPFDAVLPTVTGRSPQATTLEIDDVSDILGSWSGSSNDGWFVGNTVLGEQIALTSMQRWGADPAGSLLYGDFALRYDPTRAGGANSGLVLTSNIDFGNAAFADLGNAIIAVAGDQLTISGDLFAAAALTAFDGAILGKQFGTFSMTADLSTSAVPEPSSLVVLGVSGLMAIAYRRRRTSRSGCVTALQG